MLSALDSCCDCSPMFFATDQPFLEFFCICIQLLNRTWKEMKATLHDFTKVELIYKTDIFIQLYISSLFIIILFLLLSYSSLLPFIL